MAKLTERKRATSMPELAAVNGAIFDGKTIAASIEAYKPQLEDVIITPYAKSGTTWLQQIFHTLRTRGDMEFEDISAVVPWIEMAGTLDMDINADQRATPRGFKSHLSFDKMPQRAKYINAIRDPVDAAYSAFKFVEGWFVEPGSISADEFVLASSQDANYFKHFVSWWPQRHADNVLYLVYEHMQQDLEATITQVARFADIPLDDELLELTLKHASLPFMQAHKDRFDDAMLRSLSEEEVLPAGSDSAKVRKGQVGEAKLSSHVVKRLDDLWLEYVQPVTGFDNYKTLIESLR